MESVIVYAAAAFFLMMCLFIYFLVAAVGVCVTLALFEDSGRIKEEHAIVIGGLWPLSLPLILFGLMTYYLIFPMKLFIISFYKIIKGVIK
ncbi:GhoT/OrtT family toxin [Pseudomonas aeruginosa]|uniref:Toxin protein n=1 Tax=Pseudomonas phage Baskent_P1_112 TaxID=3145032 RepID=A0AAU8B9R7_9CAUD|nr:GhoT/OrtT family toxin [Pseudomonas aeruginosa]MBW6066798.1 GhoT/OrtT family toxin [Pseudomonas aeruginosa]QSH71683.1 hypothetical protein [Pseudomonas phage vB_PaeP_fHoPae04]UPO63129.1 hypothetical protein [Pseudomonas phage ZCPS1]WOR80456.1 hypothetical protein PSP30_gp20 [Pseudomonas phage PSP30]